MWVCMCFFLTHGSNLPIVLLQFLLGTPLHPADLLRARTDVAALCIVLSPRHAPNHRAADVETVLRYLSVRRCFPDLRMAVQLLGSEDIKLVSPFDPVLSVTDYKVKLRSMRANTCVCHVVVWMK